MKVGDQITVRIENMSLHGGGVARHEGFVFFIDFTAPGDEALVEIIELKKNYGFARLNQLLNPSQERKNPPCPVFGRCGGCNWQHLSEESQASWKERLVREALGKAWPHEFQFLPLVQSPKPFRYRNRIQLKKKGNHVGYFAAGTHDLVDIQDCPLAEERLVPLIEELRKRPESRKNQNRTHGAENWELSLTEDHQGQIRSLDQRDLAFSQVNRFVNELLIQEVLEWSADRPFETFWDLYCGAGNFTFPLFEKFPKCMGLGAEMSASAVEEAQLRSSQKNISPKRLEFMRADVGHLLKRLAPPDHSLILLDPPRAGLDESVVKALAHSKASTLLYISCNPMSLARDLSRFHQAAPDRWELGRVRCFDMFPQTDHVETLVELKR